MNTYNNYIGKFYLFNFIMYHIYFIVASMKMIHGGNDQI